LRARNSARTHHQGSGATTAHALSPDQPERIARRTTVFDAARACRSASRDAGIRLAPPMF